MLNKIGADRETMALVWLVVILGGTTLALFWMMNAFYGTPYDIRELEARLLLNKVADCVSYSGRINPQIISNGVVNAANPSFLESCHLNFASSEWEEEQYYSEINIYSSLDLSKSLFFAKKGNDNFVLDCEIQIVASSEFSSKCLERSFNTFDDKNQEYTVKILTAVRKLEKNVKF